MILGAIITYNPDFNLLKSNIETYSERVDSLIIIDNNSHNFSQILELQSDKIKVISNVINVGIAKALNQALDYACLNKFEFLLTMDQDSFFEKRTVQSLILGFKNKTTAIVCPSLKDINSNHITTVTKQYDEVLTTITSGCLCRVDVLKLVGGFESKMFIDYVDIELCLRLQKNGFKILRSQSSVLCHHLGESKLYTFLGIDFISTNHSPLRRFYYARNKVYVYKKYFLTFPGFIIRDMLSFCKTIFIILFFEPQKTTKIKMVCKGIWHGLFFM